jgi:hypothetical protein
LHLDRLDHVGGALDSQHCVQYELITIVFQGQKLKPVPAFDMSERQRQYLRYW